MTADGKEKTARTGAKVQAVVATAAAARAPDKGKVPAGGRGIGPAAVCKAAYIYLTLPLLIFLGLRMGGLVPAADGTGFL